MAAKHTLHVALTEPLVRYVHDQVASGQYATASEVVRAALRAFHKRQSPSTSRVSDKARPAQPMLDDPAIQTSLFPMGGGAMGAAMRSRDWSTSSLGPLQSWPISLRTTVGMILASPESMALVWGPERSFFFNDAYSPALGPAAASALGQPVADVWPELWAQFELMAAKAFAGEASRFVDVPAVMTRPGEVGQAWWTFSFSPVTDEGGAMAGVLCIISDTTARVRADEVLRRSEAHSRQIIDSATDFAIVATDLDGRVTRWNEGARRILGWTEEEMLGQPVDCFFTPEDVAAGRVATEMHAALETGHGTDERWHQRKGGERFWAIGELTVLRDDSGAEVGFVKVLRDRTERRQSEQALREAAANLKRAQQVGGVGLFWIGIDDNIVYPTEEFCRIFGLPVADAYPAEIVESIVISADRNTGSNPAMRKAGAVPRDVRYRIRHGVTGEKRWIARQGEIETGADGRPVRLLGTVRDVTEQVNTQEALRALTASLERQVEERTRDRDRIWRLSRDMLGVADQNGVWLAVNPAWTTILGWSPEDLLDRTSDWLQHPSDVERTRVERERLVAGQSVVSFETRWRTRDGTYRLLSWTAVPFEGFTYGIGRDVTVERERFEALRRSEAKAATYFNFSQDYLFLVRVGSDDVARFEDMNAPTERVMRLRRAEVVGRPVSEFVPPDSARDIDQYARLCLSTRQPQSYLARRRYRDGAPETVVDGRVAFVEGFDDGGGLVLFSGHDVTEQRVIEEALRQSQKMEAVGQLTGGLAHDFNNLLTGITGSLDLLQKRVAQGRVGELDRYVIAAQGAAKRAAALTHRLLAFSRRQTLDPKPTDVSALLKGMTDLVRRTVGPAIAVEIVDLAGLWTALVDPSQLENALLNLCINARDAMPDGGRITIETGNRWMDDRAGKERDLPPGQYLSLCVSDTGTGMPPDVAARAFEPFFTTKPLGQGTGLGLSMIYGFAKQSGGQVRIYSEPGQGAMVCIYLPRHYGEGEVHEASTRAATPSAEDGETVLVIDDEPTVRMLVADVLSDLGYAALEAEDGPSGLRILQSDLRVDLLITDVGLPNGMNGRQVADAARALRPGLKVLFITGYAENAAVGNGHMEPGMAVLTKPFAMDDLGSKIRSLIEN